MANKEQKKNESFHDYIDDNQFNEHEKQAKEVQRFFGFIGFSVFDTIHIAFGLFFFAWYWATEPTNHIEIAECVVEIVISVTLFLYVHALAENNIVGRNFRRTYSFAWLMASTSLLMPCLFRVVELSHYELTYQTALLWVHMGINIALYVCFFLSVIGQKKAKIWKIETTIGCILAIISSTLAVAVLLGDNMFGDGISIMLFIFLLIKHLAPMFLAIMGIIGSSRAQKKSITLPKGEE